jgi:hypothetical protein
MVEFQHIAFDQIIKCTLCPFYMKISFSFFSLMIISSKMVCEFNMFILYEIFSKVSFAYFFNMANYIKINVSARGAYTQHCDNHLNTIYPLYGNVSTLTFHIFK